MYWAKSLTDTYNARDELTSEQTTANGTTTTTQFGYDVNGSETTITTAGSLQQMEVYSARGRLLQVLNGSGAVQESILYTASGDRASVTQYGTTTDYIVDEQSPTGYSQVVEEYQGGILLNSYIFGSGLDPISQNTNTGGSGLSSVLLLSDGHSGVRQAYLPGVGILLAQRFDAFGNTVITLKAIGTPFTTVIGYQGQQFDPVLGQYYLRARLYDPVSGRFTATDPAATTYNDVSQLMRYGYAAANPLWGHDPSGRDFTASEELEVADVGETQDSNSAAAAQAVRNNARAKVAGIYFYTGLAGLNGSASIIGHSGIYVEQLTTGRGVAFDVGTDPGVYKRGQVGSRGALRNTFWTVSGEIHVTQTTTIEVKRANAIAFQIARLSSAQEALFLTTIGLEAGCDLSPALFGRRYPSSVGMRAREYFLTIFVLKT